MIVGDIGEGWGLILDKRFGFLEKGVWACWVSTIGVVLWFSGIVGIVLSWLVLFWLFCVVIGMAQMTKDGGKELGGEEEDEDKSLFRVSVMIVDKG